MAAREHPPAFGGQPAESREPQECDRCGANDLEWIKCKLICRNCRQIVMTCADLLRE